jgi:hypothetical protein
MEDVEDDIRRDLDKFETRRDKHIEKYGPPTSTSGEQRRRSRSPSHRKAEERPAGEEPHLESSRDADDVPMAEVPSTERERLSLPPAAPASQEDGDDITPTEPPKAEEENAVEAAADETVATAGSARKEDAAPLPAAAPSALAGNEQAAHQHNDESGDVVDETGEDVVIY